METRLINIAANAGLSRADLEFGTSNSNQSVQFTANGNGPAESVARRYLIASITKPIVAMALLKLVGEGEISLVERLGTVLPEFSRAIYRRITLRDLLTHTSGFPDMLPNNTELRAAHAGLPDFVAQAASIDLDFTTANDCRYSSVGFLLIGEIIQTITKQSLAEFLRTQFFEPIGMAETWLGMSDIEADSVLPTVLPCELPEWQQNSGDWGWNSRYWRTLGAPWGGMISSTVDLGRFARMILCEGTASDGTQILPAAIIKAACTDQTAEIAAQSNYSGRHRPWGLGWRRQWPSHSASFGDFVSKECIGHWGATGTLMWIDPANNSYAVMLTTTPYEQSQSPIQRLSNVIATNGHRLPN